jgi:transcriptional regulator with XRE-family HTH domain
MSRAVLNLSTLDSRLLELRKKKGLKQREMAEFMGISLRAWQYYESGEKKPDVDGLTRLADFFDVSMDYLSGRSDDPNPPERGEVSPEEAEFLKWVDENLEGSFFYDFDKSPEDSKKYMMETLRMVWEREKGRKPGQKQGE